jgi:hypothetical protein
MRGTSPSRSQSLDPCMWIDRLDGRGDLNVFCGVKGRRTGMETTFLILAETQ